MNLNFPKLNMNNTKKIIIKENNFKKFINYLITYNLSLLN